MPEPVSDEMLGLSPIQEGDPESTEFAVAREWIDPASDEQLAKESAPAAIEYYKGTNVPKESSCGNKSDGLGYQKKYDNIAYKMMQDSDSTVLRVCIALKITQPGLAIWRKKYPSFNRAIIAGRLIGEDKFRRKINDIMYKPAAGVNTGLIKMMASNMYGIDDTPQIVINNNQSQDTKVLSEKETSQLYANAIEKSSTELEGFNENFDGIN